MRKKTAAVILGLSIVIVLFAAHALAPKILGAGPAGIDLRPVPGTITPEAILPETIADYKRCDCTAIKKFHDLSLQAETMEGTYTGRNGNLLHIIAVRTANRQESASAIKTLATQLQDKGFLQSCRLRAEEPYKGWWSASGKRNFAYWYAPTWTGDQHGFIWQSGSWYFIVASNNPIARRDVTLAFTY